MSPRVAEYVPGADTPRGALLRAAIAAVVLVGLLIFATREDAPTPKSAAPPAASPLLPEPQSPARTAAPVSGSDEAPPVVAAPGEPVPAVGAPSGEPARPGDAPAQPDLVEAPPAEPQAPADDATAQRPERAAPAPEPPLPTALGPRPPDVAVADARVITVIPQGAEPRAQDRPPPPPVAAVNEYRVRLGGFVPIDEARALHGASVEAGYPARVLHRVLLGPFGSRGEAKAAQSGTRGILIGGGEQWWVQLGVFADARNAQGLHDRMAGEGRAAVLQGRVELGPFGGRAAAEQVLIALRDALDRPLDDARIYAP